MGPVIGFAACRATIKVQSIFARRIVMFRFHGQEEETILARCVDNVLLSARLLAIWRNSLPGSNPKNPLT